MCTGNDRAKPPAFMESLQLMQSLSYVKTKYMHHTFSFEHQVKHGRKICVALPFSDKMAGQSEPRFWRLFHLSPVSVTCMNKDPIGDDSMSTGTQEADSLKQIVLKPYFVFKMIW